jgi:hypothetical protein
VRPDSGQRIGATIDGRSATMIVRKVNTSYFTMLDVGGDEIILGGEAVTPEGADLQLVIFRTVRFIGR